MKTAQFSSILILSFFDGKQKWIGLVVMMIIPYISKTLNWLWGKFLSWYYPTTVTITLCQKTNKDGVPLANISYRAMCWYTITKHCEKQKALLCEGDSIKKNEKIGNSHKRIPDYSPNNSFDLSYEGSVITISFFGGDQKSIKLRSKTMVALTEFVSYVNGLYENHCYNAFDSNKIYVCEWNIPQYSRDPADFTGTEMTIKKTYSNVYLPSQLIGGIKKDIKKFRSNEAFYDDNGIPYKRGYLFYGPPGTGKTSTVYAIARENNMNLYKLDLLSDVKARRQGITLKIITQKIPPGSVVLIEEVDTQVYNDRVRSNKTDKKDQQEPDGNDQQEPEKTNTLKKEQPKKEQPTEEHEKTINKLPMSELMEVLDGYDTLHGCIVILTTNHKEYLDAALIRPGRVDMHYHFGNLESVDIKTTIKRFSGFDMEVHSDLTLTSSTLINQILLPNRGDKIEIQNLISSY